MEPSQLVCSAVYEAASLSRQAVFVARAERNKLKIRISKLEAQIGRSIEATAEARAVYRLASQLLWVPLLRGHVLRKNTRTIEGEAVRVTGARDEAGKLRHRLGLLDGLISVAEKNATLLGKAGLAAEQLGFPPKRIEDAAVNLAFQVKFLGEARPGLHWIDQVSNTSREVIDLVKTWAKAKAEMPSRQISVPVVGGAAKPAVIAPARKIYLPIPSSMSPVARDLGAGFDKEAPRGASPWYVTTAQDLAPFRNLLPIAYRPEVTKFEFPPIPFKASGQNLWGFFDRATWDRVRKTSYSMTGHRCAICGGRGGFIADKVLRDEERRHGVDCHEVWDWQVADESTGVGVQKLKRLLVVCSSCHSTFHSGYFSGRGRDIGMEDEVRSFIEKRRMLINRVGLDELNTDLEATKAEMQRAKGIDKWVIDLESLSNQQFMADHTPILRERNDAGVAAERIAGISFETDAGEYFSKRSAQQIYDDLVGAELEVEQGYAGMR